MSRLNSFSLRTIIAIQLIFPFILYSQKPSETPAILLRGPYEIKGIKLLPPNSLAAFQGEYVFEKEEVQIIFTREKVVVPKDWIPLACRKLRVYRIPNEESFSVFYQQDQEFFLFFSFEKGSETWCTFIDRFVERFIFLLGFVQHEVDLPFPAILELR